MRRRWHIQGARAAALAAGLAMLAVGCTTGGGGPSKTNEPKAGASEKANAAPAGGTLKAVQDRGTLNCGVNKTVPGFGFITESGDYEGFDIDFCKAVAAAVLGDPTKVKYVPLTTDNRFTALQAREIDVLIRNSTWTASRDGELGMTFAAVNYYDGGTIMVRADSKYHKLDDINNVPVCVLSGTTNEQNLSNAFKARGNTYEPQSFDDNEQLQPAFEAGRCVAWFSDRSQLAGVRAAWPKQKGGPESLRILDEIYSKEPFSPVVRDGDSQWAQVVSWVVHATVQAEEFGITQANIDQMTQNKNADIAQFLGKGEEGKEFDPKLGLPVDFAVKVVKAVGNYGEIFERNLGAKTPLQLDRGINNLWTKGGLMYAPPYR